MAKYIFTHDSSDNSFPERYRVVGADDDAEFLRKAEDLTGTVLDTEAIAFLDELMARCAKTASVTPEFVDAPHWRFIELRFKPEEAERIAQARAEGDGGD